MTKAKDKLRKRNVKKDTNIVEEAKKDTIKAPPAATKKTKKSSSAVKYKGWFPPSEIVFGLLFFARALGAMFANINDCDEVFNFWEPTHYLQHGYGLQTWEYSPVYAIRTWAYILIHYFPLKFFESLSSNKVMQFYSLRCLLSTVSAFCETVMVQEIAKYFSPEIGIFTMVFLVCSPGMYHAAPAFLPSSFALYTTAIFFSSAVRPASDLNRKHKCLLALGIGCLLGWPFSAAIGIPFVFEEVSFYFTEKISATFSRWKNFILKFSGLIFLVLKLSICITLPIIAIDYYFYKKITFVPFNIVLYNVLGASENTGPNIFGTEPMSFYFKNGFLNFSICFILALLSFPVLLADNLIFRSRTRNLEDHSSTSLFFKLAPVYWWMGLFLIQPHKEERFLFVIYPLFAFNSAITLSVLKDRLVIFTSKFPCIDPKKIGLFFLMNVVLVYFVFSIGRIFGQYEYYYGTLELYNSFNLEGSGLLNHNAQYAKPATVCVGGEWFRFPSHYFLPGGSKLSFVKANFDGLLPKPFPAGPWRESISSIPTNTNNQNREEMDRYVPIEKCHFLVTTMPKPDVNIHLPDWEPVRCTHFLNTTSVPAWRRAFFVPPIGPFEKNQPKYYGPCLLKNKAHESSKPIIMT